MSALAEPSGRLLAFDILTAERAAARAPLERRGAPYGVVLHAASARQVSGNVRLIGSAPAHHSRFYTCCIRGHEDVRRRLPGRIVTLESWLRHAATAVM